jgi:hypothetical protein
MGSIMVDLMIQVRVHVYVMVDLMIQVRVHVYGSIHYSRRLRLRLGFLLEGLRRFSFQLKRTSAAPF